MARLGRLGFLAVGVIFHLIYIYSIFDIYFVSPIVHGMQPYSVDAPAPAKRLFLVVGDGLRADKCFQQHPDPDEPSETRYLAPFVRSKALNEGTFGISHTRVPTESRPGHVALIAGLYEDVSAVTTGWKLNPVNFDSVFNRSRHTWSWGSPDILHMFKEGASDPSRVDAWTYDEEMEDFTQDATNLDIWVFDHVREFFESAKTNATLNEMLHQDKLVFFLHLLGLDTTGHSYRPYSPEYLRNIKVVDEGLQKINALVNDFYGNDGKTAWVFTADHGMSDWGSHGDGHPDNTRTPLVAWGAGVKKPIYTKDFAPGARTGHEDGVSADWGLESVRRVDVSQADVAALMAYLVGVEFPVNSVGELPLEFASAEPETQALAAWTNAKQILEMYRVKEAQKKSTQLRYKPFGPLSNLERNFLEIETLLKMKAYYTSIDKAQLLIKRGLEGLRYLQTYDWLFLRTLITLGYVGWIAFALTTVLDIFVLRGSVDARRTVGSTIFFTSILSALYSLFIIQQSRLTYYPYAFFPVAFWEEVYVRRSTIAKGVRQIVSGVKAGRVKLFLQAIGGIALLEAIVSGYLNRDIFSWCYLLATTWPLFYGKQFVTRNGKLVLGWVGCCVIMSTFTLLDAVKQESELQILAGGAIMFAVGIYAIAATRPVASAAEPPAPVANGTASGSSVVVPQKKDETQFSRIIMGAQVGLIGLAMFVTSSSLRSLQAKQGLPLGNQIVGWIVLVTSILLPRIPHTPIIPTLLSLFITFSPSFILLTISYEGLFFVFFTALLHLWTTLESRIPNRSFLDSLRTSLFFFFLLQSGFFSTGNIASISSFSLDSVYRLIPIFSPFAMTVLLLYKIFVPFVMISAALAALNGGGELSQTPSAPISTASQVVGARKSAPPKIAHLGTAGDGDGKAVFMLATAVSDVLTLNFFWMVKDEGSWLEIGSTISNFCIGGLLGVFITVLELGAGVFSKGEGEKRKDALEVEGKVNAEKKRIVEKQEFAVDVNPVAAATGASSGSQRRKKRSGR